uniref:HAT C-terminal dimerisation domain-containing protein n=1 Tax=Ditylenchus dipsaci TaxID=166011 RepID=A0A915DEJ2_9BILA
MVIEMQEIRYPTSNKILDNLANIYRHLYDHSRSRAPPAHLAMARAALECFKRKIGDWSNVDAGPGRFNMSVPPTWIPSFEIRWMIFVDMLRQFIWMRFVLNLHFPTAAAQARVATTNTNGPISQCRSRFVSIPPVGLQNEVVAYEAHPARYDNPLEFWRDNENSFPTLAKLTRMCLGVMGSNTSSETEFKKLRPLFANADRNRLDPMAIATMIHLRQMYQKNVI